MKYQRYIENRHYLIISNYNITMTGVRTLMLNPERAQIPVFVTAVCLSLLVIFGLRDAQAATTTTTVEANIVSTINMVAQNGIVFGDVAASSIPGTVTIETDGSRTTTGGATLNTSTSGTPAKFEISGDPNSYFSISLPTSVVITSGAGDNMTIANFTSFPTTNGQMDASGKQNLNVGATMKVGSFQPFGSYKGIMSTTIEYH
jgi:hypothetical protein